VAISPIALEAVHAEWRGYPYRIPKSIHLKVSFLKARTRRIQSRQPAAMLIHGVANDAGWKWQR
jgi:hypothetical protein